MEEVSCPGELTRNLEELTSAVQEASSACSTDGASKDKLQSGDKDGEGSASIINYPSWLVYNPNLYDGDTYSAL